jgi:PKD repeat protein
VTFKGDGSYDPDGFISAYDWDFGDGSGSAETNPAKTFSVPGTYIASLVVIDNAGLSGASQTISIQVGNNKYVYVAAIDMKLATSKSGYQATATVTVRNESGQVVPNASVVGDWSGIVSGSSARTTSRNGSVSFASPRTKSRGSFIFSVSGISLSGSTYSPVNNVETSDAISTP